MTIGAIPSINMANTVYVSGVGKVHISGLSNETIKKLIELGIDPRKVKSESEAQALIARIKKEKNKNLNQNQNVEVQGEIDIQMQEMQGKSKDLNGRIKNLADKLSIEALGADSPMILIKKLEQQIAKTVETNNSTDNVKAVINKNNGGEQEDLKQELKDIKTTYDDLEKTKNSIYSAQDMIAVLNKLALGLA